VLVLKITPERIVKLSFHVHRILVKTEVLVLTQLIILRTLVHARRHTLERIARLKFLVKSPEILVSTAVLVLTTLTLLITLAVVSRDTPERIAKFKSRVLLLLARTARPVRISETCPDSFVLVPTITLTRFVIKRKLAQRFLVSMEVSARTVRTLLITLALARTRTPVKNVKRSSHALKIHAKTMDFVLTQPIMSATLVIARRRTSAIIVKQ
jgi:hypothetical protein